MLEPIKCLKAVCIVATLLTCCASNPWRGIYHAASSCCSAVLCPARVCPAGGLTRPSRGSECDRPSNSRRVKKLDWNALRSLRVYLLWIHLDGLWGVWRLPARRPGIPVLLRRAILRRGGRPGVLRRGRLWDLPRGHSHRIWNGDPFLHLLRGGGGDTHRIHPWLRGCCGPLLRSRRNSAGGPAPLKGQSLPWQPNLREGEVPRIPLPRTPVNKPLLGALYILQWHNSGRGRLPWPRRKRCHL